MAKAEFASDTERITFIREWDKIRNELKVLTKGRKIVLVECSKEYNEDLGFIKPSRRKK